jgi:hypothetical protein
MPALWMKCTCGVELHWWKTLDARRVWMVQHGESRESRREFDHELQHLDDTTTTEATITDPVVWEWIEEVHRYERGGNDAA